MAKATSKVTIHSNDTDNWVDQAVFECLNPSNYKSFFLFAGAGSGKTRTLVNVLAMFRKQYGKDFRLSRKKVAIITYTNAAADEIIHRLEQDSIFHVSTIHSFAWKLIQPYTADIRNYLEIELVSDIMELREQQSKSKNLSNKTSIDRAKRIESKTKRVEALKVVKKFIYNPNGDNLTKDSLNHTEVIAIAAHFIYSQPLMQQIVIAQYPIILIDESQDTKKELIDALFALEQRMSPKICLGLFGDTMQRIYADGKENLQSSFPANWSTPNKVMNHRSNKRIIRLINSIRDGVDSQVQQPREEKKDGFVRLFVCKRDADKSQVETTITKKMAKITGDPLWNEEDDNVKTLILEHHMAARRMGFFEFFGPLYEQSHFKTGLLDGSLSGINLLTKILLPFVMAHKENNQFEIARILKKESPLFSAAALKESGDQLQAFTNGRLAAEEVVKLWDKDQDPLITDVLEAVYKTKLFIIPENIRLLVSRTRQEKVDILSSDVADEDEKGDDSSSMAWESALAHPFSQIENYALYLSEHSKFGTHQGVKGLEYPRVMVIVDDEESKGFMFSYDKLFGTKDMSDTDRKNLSEGKETGIDRTKRLFYVACSRAKESLAIIAYTDDPAGVMENAVRNKWFDKAEVEIL
jgi:DNA helicase II / ATP-dependent DNA helicase PcrA